MTLFEELKNNKKNMNEYEYNTSMADACVLAAIEAHAKNDLKQVAFFKSCESVFRARAVRGEVCKTEKITKCSQNFRKYIYRIMTPILFRGCMN